MKQFFSALTTKNAYIILIVLLIVVYGQVVSFDFVNTDDSLLLTGNEKTTGLTAGNIYQAFTTYDPQLYIPFTLLSYQLEYSLVGQYTPWIFHTTNLLLFIGIVSTLFFLCRRLGASPALALTLSLLYGLHPINAEAVSWVAARKDLMSGFFGVLSLYYYVVWQRDEKSRHWWLSVLLFAIAALSKVTIVVLPLLLVLLDYQKRDDLNENRFYEKWPFFLVSIVAGVIAVVGKSDAIQFLSWWQSLLFWFKSVGATTQNIVWPFSLRIAYFQYGDISLFDPVVLLGLAVVFGSIALALSQQINRLIVCGLLGYILFQIPNFATVTKFSELTYSSDRYALLPLFALMLCLALPYKKLLNSKSKIITALSLVPIALLIPAGFLQTATWENSITLNQHLLEIDPQASIARVNIAAALENNGERPAAKAMLKEAVAQNDANMFAHLNLGKMFYQDGDGQTSLRHLERAVELVEAHPNPDPSYATAYYVLGEFYDEQGQVDKDIEMFERAIKLFPEQFDSHYNLGIRYQKHGLMKSASEQFARALEIRPLSVDALYRHAAVLAEQGQIQEALEKLEQVEFLSPDYKLTRQHLQRMQSLL